MYQSQVVSNQHENSYLLCEIADMTFAFSNMEVESVLDPRPLSHIPCTPAFAVGVFIHRGKTTSVIDIRKKFELTGGSQKQNANLLLMSLDDRRAVAFYVDKVIGIEKFDDRQVTNIDNFETIKTVIYKDKPIICASLRYLLDSTGDIFVKNDLPLNESVQQNTVEVDEPEEIFPLIQSPTEVKLEIRNLLAEKPEIPLIVAPTSKPKLEKDKKVATQLYLPAPPALSLLESKPPRVCSISDFSMKKLELQNRNLVKITYQELPVRNEIESLKQSNSVEASCEPISYKDWVQQAKRLNYIGAVFCKSNKHQSVDAELQNEELTEKDEKKLISYVSRFVELSKAIAHQDKEDVINVKLNDCETSTQHPVSDEKKVSIKDNDYRKESIIEEIDHVIENIQDFDPDTIKQEDKLPVFPGRKVLDLAEEDYIDKLEKKYNNKLMNKKVRPARNIFSKQKNYLPRVAAILILVCGGYLALLYNAGLEQNGLLNRAIVSSVAYVVHQKNAANNESLDMQKKPADNTKIESSSLSAVRGTSNPEIVFAGEPLRNKQQ